MIFYFTGTGNSLYAAKQLEDSLFSIPQIMNSEQRSFSDQSIGIVCPMYGHEMPQMVKAFIARSTFNTDYLYLVLTYGARHANAAELAQAAFIGLPKQPDYITTLLMVDNFLPVFDMNEEIKLDKKIEQQIFQIKKDVAERKGTIQPVTDQDREMHAKYLEMVQDSSELFWAKFKVTNDCIGCGICTKVCPGGSIRLENQRAVHTDENCQACFACIHVCPKLAIVMNMPEKNPTARYRNEHIALAEIVSANNQTEN